MDLGQASMRSDSTPPLTAAQTVAADGDLRLLDTLHQVDGEVLSVFAGVGDETAGRLGHESK